MPLVNILDRRITDKEPRPRRDIAREWDSSQLAANMRTASKIVSAISLWRSIELITKAGGKIELDSNESDLKLHVQWKGAQYGKCCLHEKAEQAVPLMLHQFCVDHL